MGMVHDKRKFQNVFYLFFSIICCQFMLELPHWGNFNMYQQHMFNGLENLHIKKVSEYDQEIPQSHTADQPTHREEESQNTNSHKTSERQF